MFKITSIVPNRIFGRPPSSIRCRSDPECKVIPYESRRQSQLVMKSPLSNRHFLPVPTGKKNAPAGILSLAGAFRIRNWRIKTCLFPN